MEEIKKSTESKNKPEATKKANEAQVEASPSMGDSNTKPHVGIPKAQFVEDVDSFMALAENEENAEKVLKKFDEQHSKYKFMEFNLAAKQKRIKNQIPDIQKSIDMIDILAEQKSKQRELDTHFLLSNNVYMKASIPPTNKVLLWLGADIMLEYDLKEATKVLKNNLAIAKKNLEIINDDLDFLRDQITTTEVNRARVFNWDVKRNLKAKVKPI